MGCVYVCSCPDPFSLGNHFNTFPPCNKKFKAKQISAGLLPRAKTHTETRKGIPIQCNVHTETKLRLQRMIVSEHKHSLHFMVMTMSLEQTRALSQSFSWPGEVHSAKQQCCLRNLASTQARSRSLGGLKHVKTASNFRDFACEILFRAFSVGCRTEI